MRRTHFILLAIAGPLTAAPLKEKPVTPISLSNVQQVREIGAIQRDINRFVFMPKSDSLALMPWQGDIEVIEPRAFKTERHFAKDKKLVQFAFSPDGEKLAWAENNTSVTVEDLKTGKSVSFDTGQSQPSVVFSPDSKWLVTGGYGKIASMWDPATGKKIREFETDRDGGLTPVFSRDGKYLAIGNRNSDPRIFDPATGKLLNVLDKKMTQEIRFNPQSTLLATTYVDGSLGLWDVATGKSIATAKLAGEELYTVDWSPKGDLLTTGGLKTNIVIWDPKELKPLKEFNAPDWVIRVRFSPDGSRIYSAGGGQQKGPERKITIWGLQ